MRMPSVSENSNARQGSSFNLADLPSTIKRYPYEGIERSTDAYSKEYDRLEQDTTGEASTSEWILFHIDEPTFTQDFIDSTEGPGPLSSWSSYSASEQLLLVKLATAAPSTALMAFHDVIRDALQPMRLTLQTQPFKRTPILSERNGKQADNGWGPLMPPGDRSRKWPAVVLEIDASDCPAKLQSDVRYWLHESQGEVNVVLTLTLNRRTPDMVIEKWERQNGSDRHHRTQRVAVSRTSDRNIAVDGEPLVIEFSQLFRRPTVSDAETDIRIGREALESMAASIWKTQGF